MKSCASAKRLSNVCVEDAQRLYYAYLLRLRQHGVFWDFTPKESLNGLSHALNYGSFRVAPRVIPSVWELP